MKWKNKIVVVTGGSDGLGRQISRAFAGVGATTVVIARNESRLIEIFGADSAEGSGIDWVVGDVTDDQSVSESVAEIMKRYGRIDVWVNNVGASTRTSFQQCGVDDYRALMEINFYSAVRCSLAVLDHLTTTSGQIVNIGSLAAKTGWPNVAPYAVSKHALAAFSHQLRIEGPENVNCLFVCPGPIRRPDSNERYAAEAKGLDESATQPGAGVKLKGIPPEKLAQAIVRYCELRKKELVMPWFSRILFSLAQLSPLIGDFLLNRFTSRKK